MLLPSLADIEEAAKIVYREMAPTPQYRWPLLESRAGRCLWVKHENHTPIGAFKVRGGLVYIDELLRTGDAAERVVCATRGNHGLAIAYAARRAGIAATVVVPHGNSVEKNAAIEALGAELLVKGDDFQEALEYAAQLSDRRAAHFVPTFHPALVRGAATFAVEFLRAAQAMEAVYVPIGLGSGICGVFAAREALGLHTEIVGVVAENAPAYFLSLGSGTICSSPADTIADGLACRTPNADAFEILKAYAPRLVCVSEQQIAQAVRVYFTDTHSIAEGAGAASLAAALADPQRHRYRSVGVILSGQNIDLEAYQQFSVS